MYMDNDSNYYNAKNCEHKFVIDYIDTMFPYREGIMITYCEYCGLSKEYIKKLLDKDALDKKGKM